MNIYAHRGFSGRYPENTMTAFKKAAETGCHGIELDIQLSKDGTVVVIHDEKVDRTTDGSGWVKDMTFEQLEHLNANKTHPETAAEEHIPSFDEYCRWVRDTDMVTNIELKTGTVHYKHLEEKSLEIIHKYGIEKRVFFSSFNLFSVLKIKRLASAVPAGFLVEKPLRHAGLFCRTLGIDYYHPCLTGISKETVRECHSHHISIHVWTVNTEQELTNLQDTGADGAFCNFPDLK